MTSKQSLWTTGNRTRWFFLPDGVTPVNGSIAIRSLTGETTEVDPQWIAPFEITEEQARRLVKEQLGQALTELKHGIDEKLADWRTSLEAFNRRPVNEDTTITPDAPAAILEFFRQLPRVVGQSVSGDEARVGAARDAIRELQQRLKDAGIDVGDRMTDFPDRLASLRQKPGDQHEG
jgi:hypothetical protein